MKLHRNWEFWIKYWKVDGKACQQKKPAGSEVCLQVNEKKKKICETQKKYKKASSGSCCGRCFFGILIVAGIEYGCNIQEKNMGNLQNSYVKLDKVSNILFDSFMLVIHLCFVGLLWRANNAYNQLYSVVDEYFVGNPLLFVIYLLLVVAVGCGIKFITITIKKDESLIYYTDGNLYENLIKQAEYML